MRIRTSVKHIVFYKELFQLESDLRASKDHNNFVKDFPFFPAQISRNHRTCPRDNVTPKSTIPSLLSFSIVSYHIESLIHYKYTERLRTPIYIKKTLVFLSLVYLQTTSFEILSFSLYAALSLLYALYVDHMKLHFKDKHKELIKVKKFLTSSVCPKKHFFAIQCPNLQLVCRNAV